MMLYDNKNMYSVFDAVNTQWRVNVVWVHNVCPEVSSWNLTSSSKVVNSDLQICTLYQSQDTSGYFDSHRLVNALHGGRGRMREYRKTVFHKHLKQPESAYVENSAPRTITARERVHVL